MTYRGSGSYKTIPGALCSLVTRGLIIYNLILLIIDFYDGSNQKESIQTLSLDRFYSDPYKFEENNM